MLSYSSRALSSERGEFLHAPPFLVKYRHVVLYYNAIGRKTAQNEHRESHCMQQALLTPYS
jgi:hypothetical protein